MKNLTNISEDRSKNLQDLVEQKTRIEIKIKTTEEALNTYLDELEADLLNKLQKTFIEQELQIQNILKDIELRKSKISEMKENVTIVKSLASQFQIFMVIREFTNVANTFETDLQRLFDSGSFNWTEILGTQTDIQSVKYHLTSIGEINVGINPSEIELTVRNYREAQFKGSKGNVHSKVRVSYKINIRVVCVYIRKTFIDLNTMIKDMEMKYSVHVIENRTFHKQMNIMPRHLLYLTVIIMYIFQNCICFC